MGAKPVLTKPIRLIDIAQEAGVSKITVSKVLHGRGGNNTRVSEETAEKIRQIAAKLHYRPNLAARQLNGQRSFLIGGLLDSQANETFSRRLATLERTAADAGYRLVVGYSHGEASRIGAHLEDFLGRGVDGVLSMSHTYPEQGAEISRMLKAFENCVLVEPPVGNADFSYVSVDYVEAGRMITQHLLALGRRRIAILQYGPGYQVVRDEMAGYKQALAASGVAFDPVLIVEPVSDALADLTALDTANLNVERLMAVRPDAVITPNDGAAMWMIRALINRKIRVPQDLAVVSVDGWDIGRSYVPTLTSVDLDNQAVGQTAMTMLINQIEHGLTEKTVRKIIQPRLVIGESCGSGQ